MDPFVIFAVVCIVIALGGFFLLERHRTAALQEVASKFDLGFEKSTELPRQIDRLDFHLFSQGSNTIKNVMSGVQYGIQVKVFGYSYSTGSGQNRRTTRQSVVLFESEELDLPRFDMRPEHLLHKVGGAFGYQDIDFPGNKRFSKEYLLRGRDEAAIRSVFTDEALAYFAANPNLSVEDDAFADQIALDSISVDDLEDQLGRLVQTLHEQLAVDLSEPANHVFRIEPQTGIDEPRITSRPAPAKFAGFEHHDRLTFACEMQRGRAAREAASDDGDIDVDIRFERRRIRRWNRGRVPERPVEGGFTWH